MNLIKEEDFISSVADALQFISYYHPLDFIQAMHRAYLAEPSKSAKDAIAQILINSRMSAEGHRPLCQDTGIVVGFVKIGTEARIDSKRPLQELFDEGIRRAYQNQVNPLRPLVACWICEEHPDFLRRWQSSDCVEPQPTLKCRVVGKFRWDEFDLFKFNSHEFINPIRCRKLERNVPAGAWPLQLHARYLSHVVDANHGFTGNQSGSDNSGPVHFGDQRSIRGIPSRGRNVADTAI